MHYCITPGGVQDLVVPLLVRTVLTNTAAFQHAIPDCLVMVDLDLTLC